MKPFIHCCVSLQINSGQMESLNASDVKLLAVKVTPKRMGVNGMLTAGEGLLANGGPQADFSFRPVNYPLRKIPYLHQMQKWPHQPQCYIYSVIVYLKSA